MLSEAEIINRPEWVLLFRSFFFVPQASDLFGLRNLADAQNPDSEKCPENISTSDFSPFVDHFESVYCG